LQAAAKKLSMPPTVRKFVVRHDDRNFEPKDLQPVGSSLPPFDAASTDSTANREKILHDRAMEAAKAPVSGFAMTAFMMYMMGNQINIMTMMFLFYQVMAPFNAILNIDKTFSQFEPDHQKKHLPRTIFILGQCAIFGFLLYKLKGMGLLPTESSDWLAMWPVKEVCLQLLYLRAFANAYSLSPWSCQGVDFPCKAFPYMVSQLCCLLEERPRYSCISVLEIALFTWATLVWREQLADLAWFE